MTERNNPRKKTLADRVTVIRKRYMRESARYEKQAAKAAEAGHAKLAGKLTAAARTVRQEAGLWKLGALKKVFQGADLLRKIRAGEIESSKSLYSQGEQARRNRLAKRILSTDAGAAFYAGTIDIWRGLPYEERDSAIMDALGVDNLWDALQKVESGAGVDLMDIAADYEKYSDAAADIALYISELAA